MSQHLVDFNTTKVICSHHWLHALQDRFFGEASLLRCMLKVAFAVPHDKLEGPSERTEHERLGDGPKFSTTRFPVARIEVVYT